MLLQAQNPAGSYLNSHAASHRKETGLLLSAAFLAIKLAASHPRGLHPSSLAVYPIRVLNLGAVRPVPLRSRVPTDR